ncbi:MAG TPA: hypothetical protein VMT00_11450 [Thermoanaerobaculia bacterium]|nr:hypothetical protein [Thermoanaerobaculia bacterium]
MPDDRFTSILSSAAASALAAHGARLRIGFPLWLRLVLFRGVIAITLGRRVFVASSLLGDRLRLEATIRHELVHVEQARRLGLFRFGWQYLREYCSLRRRGLSSAAAYGAIGFEVEAREAEGRLFESPEPRNL